MRLKIYFGVILSLLLITFCHAAASADNAEMIANLEEYSIVVQGELSTLRAKTDLLLIMKDSQENKILAEFTTSYRKGDAVVFEFPKILLPENLASGKYTIEISGRDLQNPIIKSYVYSGPDRILQILREIENASNVKSVILLYCDELLIDKADFDKFTKEGQTLFENTMAKVSYDLPSESITEEDIKKIKAEIKKFNEAFNEAMCISLFESAKNGKDFDEWYERYFKTYGYDKDDPTTDYDESEIAKYLVSVKNSNTFIEKIIAGSLKDNLKDIGDYIYESTLLSVIAEKTESTVKNMMLDFSELFDFNKDGLESLSITKQAMCFEKIAGEVYGSYEEAAKALDDEITKQSGGSGSGSGTGGGNGKGGGSAVIATRGNAEESKPQTINSAKAFSDMETAEWAEEAVEFLNKRGIVKGKSEGIFAPHDYVKRSEFVKMLVEAMALKLDDAKTQFIDVDEKSWYAPYASAAKKEGILTGDDYGRFNPDELITREDMAVMLFRALKPNETEINGVNFKDMAKISDYAKSAVAYFSSKGIINGMGDGTFGAKEKATRAQAAMILYNTINSK